MQQPLATLWFELGLLELGAEAYGALVLRHVAWNSRTQGSTWPSHPSKLRRGSGQAGASKLKRSQRLFE
jgi:hypothetical protein